RAGEATPGRRLLRTGGTAVSMAIGGPVPVPTMSVPGEENRATPACGRGAPVTGPQVWPRVIRNRSGVLVLASTETVEQRTQAVLAAALGRQALAVGVGLARVGTGGAAVPGKSQGQEDCGDECQDKKSAAAQSTVGPGQL